LSFLTQKGTPLAWKEDQEEAFDTLTNTFLVAPVLAGFDGDQDVIVDMDVSKYVSSGIL
jgi:hypothetical protein